MEGLSSTSVSWSHTKVVEWAAEVMNRCWTRALGSRKELEELSGQGHRNLYPSMFQVVVVRQCWLWQQRTWGRGCHSAGIKGSPDR